MSIIAAIIIAIIVLPTVFVMIMDSFPRKK